MPKTRVVFYKEEGSTPVLDWLGSLQPREAVAKCIVAINLLKERGHELRRPHADFLEDGIYELRARQGKVQFRILYFFEKQLAVLAHGFIKPGKKVPPGEIERANGFRERYKTDPAKHTHEEDGHVAKTSDAAEVLRRRFVEGKPGMEALVREERVKANVAQQLYDLRTEAGLSQKQLAELVGTTASVICRLEDADYAGHSLTMLNRVAAALDSQIEVRFVPLGLKKATLPAPRGAAPSVRTDRQEAPSGRASRRGHKPPSRKKG